MILYGFKDGSEAIFHDDGSVVLPITMTAAEFGNFMPLAILVYHQSMPQNGYGVPIGPAAPVKPAKKRGRPAKSATVKRRKV